MEKRRVDALDAEISLLGFGCMRLPVLDGAADKIDYPAAQRMVDRAIAGGVNYFDTAWPYHNKMSEVFTGEALAKYPRERYYLASKMPTWERFTSPQEDMERLFSHQLEKCRTPYFDFYLVHALDADHYAAMKQYGMYEFLSRKKAAGAIRHLGFSFHDNPQLLQEILANYPWEFAQIQLNYLDWELQDAKAQYGMLTERGIPVIVMEPVRGGALASLNERALGLLRKAAPGASPASWAMRFAGSLPNVMTVLSGMSSLEQVEDNIKTFTDFTPLSDAEGETLREAAAAYRASGAIPCTNCGYCAGCPAGVNIPRIFSIYNLYQVNKSKDSFKGNYRTLPERGKAHNCVSCGQCMGHCPQGLKIPDRLKEIAAFAAAG